MCEARISGDHITALVEPPAHAFAKSNVWCDLNCHLRDVVDTHLTYRNSWPAPPIHAESAVKTHGAKWCKIHAYTRVIVLYASLEAFEA